MLVCIQQTKLQEVQLLVFYLLKIRNFCCFLFPVLKIHHSPVHIPTTSHYSLAIKILPALLTAATQTVKKALDLRFKKLAGVLQLLQWCFLICLLLMLLFSSNLLLPNQLYPLLHLISIFSKTKLHQCPFSWFALTMVFDIQN